MAHRDSQRLGTMYMSKAWRVRYDCIRYKGHLGDWARFDTRCPTSFQHFVDHFALLADLAGSNGLQAWNESRVFHHVGHQLRWVATYRVEFDTSLPDKVFKDAMRCKSDTVAMTFELLSKSHERLDISPATDHLYNNV